MTPFFISSLNGFAAYPKHDDNEPLVPCWQTPPPPSSLEDFPKIRSFTLLLYHDRPSTFYPYTELANSAHASVTDAPRAVISPSCYSGLISCSIKITVRAVIFLPSLLTTSMTYFLPLTRREGRKIGANGGILIEQLIKPA